ncbi:MAG: c-type cytochrome [Gammaproteobacteria bacterium]|nr:c-type cytochrome [Gammaproteobacteria bacterium]
MGSLKVFAVVQIRFLILIATLIHATVGFAAGDPEAGKAQSIVCAACHGQDGASGIDPSYPNLAGQNERYLFRQLQMIQSNQRAILLMTGQLIGKSDQDLQDLAAYYASLPGKIGQAEGDNRSIATSESIYRSGILRKGVAACTSCHSPTGGGNSLAGFPSLSGQSSRYTAAQLTAYREGVRATDEVYGGMMRDVAEGLTDTEILALADYLQGLH